MKIAEPIPYIGKSTYNDMISYNISPEGRASASRRYIEMIIDLFLSSELKNSVGDSAFYKMSLGTRIKGVAPTTSKEIIDTLYRIKDYGDKAVHFNPDIVITDDIVDKVIRDALGIYDLILVDYFNKTDFHRTQNTPVIFSTLFPHLRARVLEKLIKKAYIRSEKERDVFHRYIIALVKSNQIVKAKSILSQYKKKGIIDYIIYEIELKSAKLIAEGMKRDELPIPKVIEDCKRNFEEVLLNISDEERKMNDGLIKIISTLLDQYNASDLGDLIPGRVYMYSIDFENL